MIASLLASAAPAVGKAQELEPRQYSNAPFGFNILAVGYGFSTGSVLFDPAVELENADIDTDGLVLGYARSLALGPFSGRVNGAVGRACVDGSADYEGERVSRSVCGLTDTSVRVSVNFLGAPPLAPSQFGSFEQDLVLGASLQIVMPTGRYDDGRLLNIGTNRRAVKAEIGVSKARENWFLELALSRIVFETNYEYVGGVRAQDPISALQLHLVRNLRAGRWIAVDATHYRGGQTRTNGILNENLQSNTRLGLTLSLPVTSVQTVKVTMSSGVLTRTGTDFDTIGAVWQYRWGGKAG